MGGGGKGVDRPVAEDTEIGKQYLQLLGKADTRTQEMFNMIQPLLNTGQGQAADVLAGGPGPYTPAIQSAMGSAGQALNQSTMNSRAEWDRMGITGTDYARLNADTGRMGGQQLAGIPSTFTGPMLSQIFAALTGTQAQAVQAQGQALGTAAGVTQSAIQPMKERTFIEEMTDLMNAVANNASAFSGGAGVS